MLVRVLPHQTQVVVSRSCSGRALRGWPGPGFGSRQHLPRQGFARLASMEAAFIASGQQDGVVYAADVKVDFKRFGNRHPESRKALGEDTRDPGPSGQRRDGCQGARPRVFPRWPAGIWCCNRIPIAMHLRRSSGKGATQLREVLGRSNQMALVSSCARRHACLHREIAADIDRLAKILSRSGRPKAGCSSPGLRGTDLLFVVIREHFTPDFRRLLIDDTGLTTRLQLLAGHGPRPRVKGQSI